MNDLQKTALAWLVPDNAQAKKGPLTLEGLDFQLRFAISAICFFYIFTEPCVNNTNLSAPYCLIFAPLWLIYLYLIATKKNETLTGLLGLFMIMGMNAMIMYRGGYCLRLVGSSLGILAMFAVQGYSPVLLVMMGFGYLFLQSHFFYHFEKVYEPITQSYRIPAAPLESAVRGWRAALIIEISCLIIYQATLRKLWSNYQKAQINLEEANQKLQDSNTRLSKTVDELAVKNKQLQQALNSQDLFVACVSHELRNPLNAMLGGLDLLETQAKSDMQAQQIIKTSKICGDSLLSQINNLLDVAKINAEKLEVNSFSTKMSEFLDKFWTITRISLERKGLSGCLIVDKKLPMWLEVDSLRLEQILNNLVGNAIKFTSQGCVRVAFNWQKKSETIRNISLPYKKSQSDQQIESEPNDEFHESREWLDVSRFVSENHSMKSLSNYLSFKHCQPARQKLDETLSSPASTEGYVLKIDVIDSGCGIPKENLEKIFEPFIQGDQSITRKYGGTGLGLYIAKNLVDKMCGTIKVTSMDNIGTQFQIVLPVKATERLNQTVQNMPIRKPINVMKKTKTLLNMQVSQEMIDLSEKGIVLIVDDNPFNQNIMKTYFKKLGFESDIANNGLEGLHLYQTNPKKYMFITMDIQMPVMDGITACRMIRKYEQETNKRERIPITIVTGNCSESEQKECLEDPEIGAKFFFRKPFRLSDCQFCVQIITQS